MYVILLANQWDCISYYYTLILHQRKKSINHKKNKKMSKLIVNGDNQEVELPITVSGLIKLNNVEQPDMVSVQVNEEFVERKDFDTLELKDGDSVDFLYFMGGGC